MADFGSPVSIQSLTAAIEFYRRSQSGAAGVDFADVIERMQGGEFSDRLVISRDDDRQQQDEYQAETQEPADDHSAAKPAERVKPASMQPGPAVVIEAVEPALSEHVSVGPEWVGSDPVPRAAQDVKTGSVASVKDRESVDVTFSDLQPTVEAGADPSELHLLDRLQELQQIGLTQLFALLEAAKSRDATEAEIKGYSLKR